MYLEQFKKDKASLLKYLPFIIPFLGLMFFNLIVSNLKQENSAELLNEYISTYGKNVTLFSSLLPFALFLMLLLIWWKYIHNYSFKQLTTSRKKIDWNRFFFAFGVWGLLNVLYIGSTYLLQPQNFTVQFNLTTFVPLVLIALLFIPLQTSFEEYFFRGYFLQFIAFLTKNRLVALITSSIIFGILHLSNPEVSEMGFISLLFYIGSGFLLSIITLMDDGLELALGFHAVNNLFGALVITTNSAVFQTDAIFLFKGETSIIEIFIQVFVIFPILLLIFSKKYKWANWKQKLFKAI